VIVFLHAWGAVNPQAYGGFIEYLVRRGYLVIWPRYQEVGKTRPADATTTASSLLKAAFETLASEADAGPDPACGLLAFVSAYNLASTSSGSDGERPFKPSATPGPRTRPRSK